MKEEIEDTLWEDMHSSSNLFNHLPWYSLKGNALNYHREGMEGSVTSQLCCLLGDAEVDMLLASAREYHQDIVSAQVTSKAKGIGEGYINMFVNGVGSKFDFEGLDSLCVNEMEGEVADFNLIREALLKVGDGGNKFIMMPISVFNKIRAHFEYDENAHEHYYPCSSGDVPVIINNYIKGEFTPDNLLQKVHGWLSNKLSFLPKPVVNRGVCYVGVFDDGSCMTGLMGLHSGQDRISVNDLGPHSGRDAEVYRVKAYLGLALFNDDSLLRIKLK